MDQLIERAMQAFNANAWDKAKALCAERLATAPADPDALLVLGYAQAASGNGGEAEALLARARRLAPRDATFLLNLGGAFTILNMEAEARLAFQDALAIDAELPPALCGLGDIHFRAGEWELARSMFERALARRPGFARALSSLAAVALHENRDDDAHELTMRAAAISPNLPAVTLVRAELALRRGAVEDALKGAEELMAAPRANPQQKRQALHLTARALEQLGRFDEAFAAYAEANEAVRTTLRFDRDDHPLAPHRLEKWLANLGDDDWRKWPRPAPSAPATPVFLVGFPRSGTTLMGQILGAHPDVETLEENDRFTDAVFGLLAGDPPPDWDRLGGDDVERLRAAYWRRVAQHLGRMPAKPVVVDKMPMNLLLLPVIQLLFPNARTILAVRDPRDVVLSCFKQAFAPNYATAHFFSLKETVAYYDVSMRAAASARELLPLPVHELNYERLIAEFEPTIGAALSFMGLSWNNEVSAYAEQARRTRIRTPSARAVTQPISPAAAGGWRNYAAQLAPFALPLRPWIEAFGYQHDVSPH